MPPRRTTRQSASNVGADVGAAPVPVAPPVPAARPARRAAAKRVAAAPESDGEEASGAGVLLGRSMNGREEDEDDLSGNPAPARKGRATRTSTSTVTSASASTSSTTENAPGKKQPAKAASQSKPAAATLAPAPAPVRRSARLSISSEASDTLDAPAPPSPPARKPARALKARRKAAVVNSDSEDDDDNAKAEEALAEDDSGEMPAEVVNLAQRPLLTPSISGSEGRAGSVDAGTDSGSGSGLDSGSESDATKEAVPVLPAKQSKAAAKVESDSDEDEDAGDVTVRLDDDTASLTATPTKPSRRAVWPAVSARAGPSHVVALDPAKKEGPKPRLVIHKLVLVNFKSYQGRQEIGPFHKSFSAIVGPNGSGKSNTIDALLFVFGYRASKMRQGKLSELIHNSAGFQDLDHCAVEVWFREIVDLPGADNCAIVPNSQIIVARTAYRNNSSKYTINDRTSSFTEVTTLLKGKGIDLDHKRFLILQGEVESIAQMKPKAPTEHEDGLLEYLEDIIGTSKYKEPIEQAQIEVDAFSEDRGEKMNRLRIVEKEKSGLEAQKQEAEDFLRNTNELTRKKSLLWQFHMYTLRNNIEITTRTSEMLTGQLAAEQEKNAGNLAEIGQLEESYKEKLWAFDEVKVHMDALTKDAKKIEKEEVGLTEKKKHLVTKQKKLKKALNDDGHAHSQAVQMVTNLAEEIDKTRNNLDELEHKLVKDEADLDEVREGLKGKTEQFTSQIEVKQVELEPWVAKISEKQSAIDVAQSECAMLRGKAEALESNMREAQQEVETLQATEKDKRQKHAALKKQRSELDGQLASARKRIAATSANFETLRVKATQTRQKADEAQASMSASRSENTVLSTLGKLKEQGRLKGYHGRLGDLGVIDDKYDVAVTTACGRLNNIIVDTVEQANACMDHLRKANAGRANLICLDKLPIRDFGSSDTPEGVPRLFDLIKPKDPKFAVAFYFAVRDTLVADNMEQAKRIAFGKKRWRVVTLSGQLLETSGTMSGGGMRVMKGGMSSKFAADRVEPEVVARYERESVAAAQDLATFQQERKGLEADVTDLEKRIPEIDMDLEKLEMDLQTSGKRIKDAEERLKQSRSTSKPDAGDAARIKTVEAEIATSTKEVERLRTKASAIETKIKELQDKILEVGGIRLLAMQSKVTNTKSLIDIAIDKITKAEVGQAKAQRDVEKHEKALTANQAKLEELEGELEVAEADLLSCSADLQIIQARVQEAQDGLEAVQDDLAEAKKELDEKSQFINAFRALEMDIKQKLDDNARIQKESRVKFKHWQNRYAELELAHVDEDDEDEEDCETTGGASRDGENSEGNSERPAKAPKLPSDVLQEYSDDELDGLNKDVVNAEITQLEEEIGRAKPNLNVLAEYRKRESEFLDRAKDLESVTSQRDRAKARYDDLRKSRLEEFMTGFSAISSKLKEMYQMITLGGNAELELVDSMDPFSEGIIFSVMPPKKSWKNISNLSGGEKTLSSLALVFALHVFKPTPLYFMDEIDAALDFRNVSIIANYIKSKTEAAQFIIISLRNDMFELSHRLVGIYKTSNCTKSIAIDNKDLRLQGIKGKPGPKTPGRAAVAPSSRPGSQVVTA